VICLGCIAITLTITASIIFGIERHKENNFIENFCLVVDAIAVLQGCSETICYVPVWTVEYNDSMTALDSSQNRVRITGSTTNTYAGAMNRLEEYPVSVTN
jgi:galactokinase